MARGSNRRPSLTDGFVRLLAAPSSRRRLRASTLRFGPSDRPSVTSVTSVAQVRLAFPHALHGNFFRLVAGMRRASKSSRALRKALRAWRVRLARAWKALRLAADSRARRLIAHALARGHERGHTMLGGFEQWAARWRQRKMRRALDAALRPRHAALSYALGRLMLLRRIKLAAIVRLATAAKHHLHRKLREALGCWYTQPSIESMHAALSRARALIGCSSSLC